MSTLLITLLIAFVVVVAAVSLLGIGWLLTGKSKIRAGTCGRDPNKKKDKASCGTDVSCSLCDRTDDEKK